MECERNYTAASSSGRCRPSTVSTSALATATAISIGSLHRNTDLLTEDIYSWSLASENLEQGENEVNVASFSNPLTSFRFSSSNSELVDRQQHEEMENCDSPRQLLQREVVQRVTERRLSDVSSFDTPAATSTVDWIGGRGLATGTLSTRHEPINTAIQSPVNNIQECLQISCDDTVLEFGMETEMGDEDDQDGKWPHEHHIFEHVAVFSWTLVSLASVARRYVAGRWVDSPPLLAPDQPETRWLVRLFPSGLPDNERAHMVTSFGCLSLDSSLGNAAVARVTLEAESSSGPLGCEYMTLLRPGLFHCSDFLLPRHGAPRDLHLTVRVAWSGFSLPPLLAAPPPVHGLVTRFDTGRVLRRRRHDSYQVRVRAVWRVQQFADWRPPRGTQLVSPIFGCNAVVWSLQLWPNGGRAADPEGFLRVAVHLLHLPAAMREEGVRVSMRVNDGFFRNTVLPLLEDGSWGCLAGPRNLISLSAGGTLVIRVELWYDSPAAG